MTRTFDIPVEIGEDILMVEVTVDASYGNHGIGSYEYWGFKGSDVQMGWMIEDYTWDESKYTMEQNQAIHEACMREESNFYDAINEEL